VLLGRGHSARDPRRVAVELRRGRRVRRGAGL